MSWSLKKDLFLERTTYLSNLSGNTSLVAKHPVELRTNYPKFILNHSGYHPTPCYMAPTEKQTFSQKSDQVFRITLPVGERDKYLGVWNLINHSVKAFCGIMRVLFTWRNNKSFFSRCVISSEDSS